MKLLATLFAFAVAASPATAQTDMLDSCSKQSNCIFFTQERVTGANCGSSCDVQVCMNIDYTKNGCSKVQPIRSTCQKMGNGTCTTPNTMASATKMDGITEGHRQCQIVKGGDSAEFLINDGTQCSNSWGRYLLNYGNLVGMKADCSPFRASTTSGTRNKTCTNNPDNMDCYWKIGTTTSCDNLALNPVNSRRAQEDFENNLKSVQAACTRVSNALIALNTTELPKISIPSSRPGTNVSSYVTSVATDVRNCNAIVTSAQFVVNTWDNRTFVNVTHALRLQSESEQKLAIAQVVANQFVEDKKAADADLLAASTSLVNAELLTNTSTLVNMGILNSRPRNEANTNMTNCRTFATNAQNAYNTALAAATTSSFNATIVKVQLNITVFNRDLANAECRRATAVMNTFFQDKALADIEVSTANAFALLANETYSKTMAEVDMKIAPSTRARTDAFSQLNSCLSEANKANSAFRSVLSFANTSNFNLTSARFQVNEAARFRETSSVFCRAAIVIADTFLEARKVADEAMAMVNRSNEILARSEKDCVALIGRCGSNTACTSAVNKAVASLKVNANDAKTAATTCSSRANEYNVNSAKTELSKVAVELNNTLTDANTCRALVGLSPELLDRDASDKAHTEWSKRTYEQAFKNATAEADRAIAQAKLANALAMNYTSADMYKDAAVMFAKLSTAASVQAVAAAKRAADALASQNPFDAVKAAADAQKNADDSQYGAQQAKSTIDSAASKQSNQAQARNIDANSMAKLQSDMDKLKMDADNADMRAKLLISQGFVLGQTCTDDATRDLIVRVKDAAFKTAAARKVAADNHMQGDIDDLKRATSDALQAAADTEKAFDDAKKSCEKRKKDLMDSIASVSNLIGSDCESFKEFNLNFDEAPAGAYVTDFFVEKFNVTISALGGFSPASQPNAARIFDSENPVVVGDQGDMDLASPNVMCGGKGVGSGGAPNSAYPNCVPQKKLLIIQRNDNAIPDDATNGGTITFAFDTPMVVDTIGLMDLDDKLKLPVVNIYTSGNDQPIVYTTVFTGDNGLLPLSIKEKDVVKVEVIFKSSGAVSYLRYLRCLSRKRDDDLYIGGGDNDPDKPVGTVRSTDKSVYVPSGVKQAVGCLQDMYGGSGGNKKLVCGMKNVYLDKVAAAARGTCNQGDSIIVDIKASLMFKVGRYDVGWYIATDGGDALKGSCVVSILEQGKRYNVVSAPGEVRPVGKVAWDNDALPIALNKNDACGDVFIDGGSGAIDMNNLVISQNVTCVDKNDDGNLDFGICFTFRTNLNDGKCDPAAPIPGDAQTCYCARYDVPQISVVKPDSIAAKC